MDVATADAEAAMPPSELAGRLIACAILLSLSALFSGLTLGLLGLDLQQLQIVVASGTPAERRSAGIILPLRRRGNFTLCVLLIGNVAVNSLMSILLADLTSGLVGFVVSTLLIVLLGEIIPQALCARHALRIGASFVPVVRVFMFLTYPLSKPISLLLDYCLGEEIGKLYTRAEFKHLLQTHLASNKLSAIECVQLHVLCCFHDRLPLSC